MEKYDKKNFIKTLIGAIIFSLSNFPITTIIGLSVYITSFIHLNQSFVTMHYGTFFQPINQISTKLIGPIGGILENKIGFHETLFLGSFLIFISLIGFYVQQNIYYFYILICIMGIGNGISIPYTKNLIMYIPKRKGFISSAIMIPNIISLAIFKFIGEKIINKEGYTLNPKKNEIFYPERICKNIEIYLMLCIIVFPILRIISMILMKKYKEKKDIQKLNNKNIENYLIGKYNNNENNEDIMKVLKNYRFWLIGGISFFATFNQHFIVATSRTFGALIGIDGKILQYLGIINSLSLITISPLFGYLSDKIGTKIILTFIIIINGLISFCFYLFIDNNLMFIILNFSMFIVFSGFLTIMNPHIMHIFGLKNSIILIGINGIFATVSNIISSCTAFIISKFYPGITIKNPYKICFLIGAFLNFISFILINYDSDVPFDYDGMQKNDLIKNKENELEEN